MYRLIHEEEEIWYDDIRTYRDIYKLYDKHDILIAVFYIKFIANDVLRYLNWS